MAKNISLMGASYSDVPAVTLPQTGGGTARFDDASVTTATAADVAQGKVFLAADGTITTGTATGGGAVDSVNGQTGDVVLTASDVGALPDTTTIPTKTSDLTNDSGYMTGMTILAYGKSTWNDFITAYTANHIVYCRASSNANPASGAQTRMAFMAYVNNEASPTNVEFQYYRSMSSHSDAQQGDQVYVYKLDKTAGWTVTVRECYTRIVAGTNMSSSYSSGTLTLNFSGTIPSTAADVGAIAAPSSPTSGDVLAYDGTAWVAQAPSGGLSADVKTAILNCFQHVAWIDDQGQTYYDALYSALHDGLVSISAVYTQTKIVDITDALDVLRPDLVVTATYGDSTTRTVTGYTLSGSLTVGTSTITVAYQGETDTFNVTVIGAFITAVYTQSGTVYTDDSLDSLKADLVVTYYADAQATGVVLSENSYTLSGTLTEGTSVITASYQGLTDTFNVTAVDYYEQAVWTTSDLLQTSNVAPGLYNDTCGYSYSEASNSTRRSLWAYRGLSGAYNAVLHVIDDTKYPIPVPSDASAVTIACSNISNMYYGLSTWTYNESTGKYTRTQNGAWTSIDTSPTTQLPNGTQFITANFKIGAAAEVFTTEPDVTITYS